MGCIFLTYIVAMGYLRPDLARCIIFEETKNIYEDIAFFALGKFSRCYRDFISVLVGLIGLNIYLILFNHVFYLIYSPILNSSVSVSYQFVASQVYLLSKLPHGSF